MLTYQPILPKQYDELFQLMQDEAADYLEHTLHLIQMTTEQFKQLFQTVGEIYGIYQNERLAGFYWIEERERTLHLHALILRREFQRKGIGTQALQNLEREYRSRVDTIELGVHQSNEGAKSLYEKLGYRTVNQLSELGFFIMQKSLQE